MGFAINYEPLLEQRERDPACWIAAEWDPADAARMRLWRWVLCALLRRWAEAAYQSADVISADGLLLGHAPSRWPMDLALLMSGFWLWLVGVASGGLAAPVEMRDRWLLYRHRRYTPLPPPLLRWLKAWN